VFYNRGFSAFENAMVELNAHAKEEVSTTSQRLQIVTMGSLPARHLAHALLNVIVHTSAEAKELLQFRPVEDKVRCDQYSAE